jgi:predicted RNA-binding Zn-ribbon protein involved in translation (DUF1610 family)
MKVTRVWSGKMGDRERIDQTLVVMERTLECKACRRSTFGINIVAQYTCPNCGELHTMNLAPKTCAAHMTEIVQIIGDEVALRKVEGLMNARSRIGEILGEGRRRQRVIRWLKVAAFISFVAVLLLIFYLAGGTAQ